MILTKLMGGLGNQMFQYAAARRLACRHGVEVCLDLTFFDCPPSTDTLREYGLGSFQIQARRASRKELAEVGSIPVSYWQRSYLWAKRIFAKGGHCYQVVHDNCSGFQPTVLDLSDNCFLFGYWQSEKYFIDIRHILLDEFRPVVPLSPISMNKLSRIHSSNSVSIHFRRGDYVNCPKTAAVHGTLSMNYYHRALEIVRARVKDPELFIFSDDPAWVLRHFDFPVDSCVLMSNSESIEAEDLFLMSQCKHNIIANSSFSWWAAWLNPHQDKCVIAPNRWFVDPKRNKETGDLCPGSWVRC